MQSPSRWSLAVWLCLSATVPAWAQIDRIGGPVEFRSADRPIDVPTLRIPEAAGLSSDATKLLGAGPPAPEDVLKRIDIELGRTGPTATGASDAGRTESLSNAGEHLENRAPSSGTYK